MDAYSTESYIYKVKQLFFVAILLFSAISTTSVYAWTGSVPLAIDINPDPDIFETTLVAARTDREIKGPNTTLAQMYTFNGASPGPEIRVKAGDRVILHVINNLPAGEDITIHSHGVELSNSMDGTSVTQDSIPSGGSFDYDYIAPRAGTFWYHSHASTSNDTFRGLYGPLIVTEPAEEILRDNGVLPSLANTHTLVLSDITLCEDISYEDPELIQGACLNQQPGFVPPIQPIFNCRSLPLACLVREGKTVLSNGRMVQEGDMLNVTANQPVRFRVINTSAKRYFRLVQPDSSPLMRIGGEGGLLDNVVLDPVSLPAPSDATHGDILLGPAERADIVFTPQTSDVGNIITILSDIPPPGNYNRGNATYFDLTTAPVLQLNVLPAATPDSNLKVSDSLLTHPTVNSPIEDLSIIPESELGQLLEPERLNSIGSNDSLITFNVSGGDHNHTPGGGNNHGHGNRGPAVDGVRGRFMNTDGFESVPHIITSRFAVLGDVLELNVTNATGADHNFHLHGNSFQVTNIFDGKNNHTVPVEFIDTVNLPKKHTITFRVRLEDKPQIIDNVYEPYGGLGRWLFHCHITLHAELGMISELTVVAPPKARCQDVNLTIEEDDILVAATIDNQTFDPDGDTLTLAQTPAGPYALGATSVTLTAEDSTGLTSSCSATVNVSLADDDNDGVYNKDDFCPDTSLPETAPTKGLRFNRFALINDDQLFDTASPKSRKKRAWKRIWNKRWKKGWNNNEKKRPEKTFNLDQTSGCSCEQIIETLDLGKGHKKYGCSLGVMKKWSGL